MAVPDHGPVAEVAKAVCTIRDRNFTSDSTMTPCGIMPAWRAIILETILLDMISGG